MASSSSSPTEENDTTEVLRLVISSTISLLTQFESSLSSSAPAEPAPSLSNSSEILSSPALLRTAPTLIRAHTTKLSLLLITPPFTPSAIVTVLRELSTGPLPVLMSATELLCNAPNVWSRTFGGEVKRATLRLCRELQGLFGAIQPPGVEEEEKGKKGKKRDGREEGEEGDAAAQPNLTATGVVWEACDALILLEKQGVAGVVAGKAQEYHDLIEDAISELREWMRESDEDDEDEDEVHDDASAADEFEQLFQPSEQKLPKDNEQLNAQLEATLKRLTLVKMLYKALIKRRLKGFPVPGQDGLGDKDDAIRRIDGVRRLDEVMQDLKDVQEDTDGLADAFYSLDGERVAACLDECLGKARHAAVSMRRSWSGEEDEFGSWLEKWIDMIDDKK